MLVSRLWLLGLQVAFPAFLALNSAPVQARSILFVANSFTFGFGSPVRTYHSDLVTDLNGEGIGGVPALFKLFATEAGIDWTVSLETSPGKDLAFHYNHKQRELAGAWDVVVLQGYSTLDIAKPGDSSEHVRMAGLLAAMFRRGNPKTDVELESTWARADQVYPATGHWHGKTVAVMAEDLAQANRKAMRLSSDIEGTIPVGKAWIRAMQEGVADPNPYDGIDFGKVDLWTWDHYHASTAGYYLTALVIFGKITKINPRSLGKAEIAGDELGLDPKVVVELQRVAAEELAQIH